MTFGGGSQPSGGTVAQSFATVIGTSYLVSFAYGAIGASQEQSLLAAVVSGDTTALTATAPTATNDFAVLFGSYSFTFVAGATLSMLSFTDTSLVTDSVDGLLGLGAMRRRARRG